MTNNDPNTITVCDFANCPNEFPRPTDFMSFEETEQIYRRWASLCHDDVRNACLLAGLLNEKNSYEEFEKVWQLIWDGIGELGLESTKFEDFAIELGRLIAGGYVEARDIYVQLYWDGMEMGENLKTISGLFPLDEDELRLVEACNARKPE